MSSTDITVPTTVPSSCKLFDVKIAFTAGEVESLLEQGYDFVTSYYSPPENVVRAFFRKPLTTSESLPVANEIQGCATCDYTSVSVDTPVCRQCKVTCLIRSNWKPLINKGYYP